MIEKNEVRFQNEAVDAVVSVFENVNVFNAYFFEMVFVKLSAKRIIINEENTKWEFISHENGFYRNGKWGLRQSNNAVLKSLVYWVARILE
jgi:hypothetical protein